jgi:hypothetical protein
MVNAGLFLKGYAKIERERDMKTKKEIEAQKQGSKRGEKNIRLWWEEWCAFLAIPNMV